MPFGSVDRPAFISKTHHPVQYSFVFTNLAQKLPIPLSTVRPRQTWGDRRGTVPSPADGRPKKVVGAPGFPGRAPARWGPPAPPPVFAGAGSARAPPRPPR